MSHDVVIVGGGHNGLVTAGLLAKGGLKPLVLERRAALGGVATTEEFHPGFKASVADTASLRTSVVESLRLRDHGLQMLDSGLSVFAPLADGRGLAIFKDPERTAQGIADFSAKDSKSYRAFHESAEKAFRLVSKILDLTPPDIDKPGIRDALPFLGVGLGFRRLGRVDAQRLLRWGPMAVADFASEWFETEALRAIVAGRGIVGTLAGPWSAGTTANLLLSSGAGGGLGSAAFVRGGMAALSNALAASARSQGAEIRTGAGVERIQVREGRVSGVTLSGGEEIPCRAVVSSADPHETFLRLLEPTVLDPEDLRRIRNYQIQGMASKVHLALSDLPVFKGAKDPSLLRGRIQIGPDVDYLERAFDDAKYGRMSAHPLIAATIPTLTDPGQAPQGRHVLSAYVQYTPYRLRSGDWDSRRDELGDTVVRTLEEYAPGLSRLVLGRQVLTPRDLERTYGLTAGHPSHGEPSLNQLFAMRPLLGWGRYRGPLAGLYLCGAGTHPGGGITGAPGANAAREILRDLR